MAGLVALFIATALIGLAIGNRKGRAIQGLLLGLLLSVIGIVIIAFLPVTEEMKIRRAQEKMRIKQQQQKQQQRVGPLIRLRRNRGNGKDFTPQQPSVPAQGTPGSWEQPRPPGTPRQEPQE
jgi:uncharacterized membrane protein